MSTNIDTVHSQVKHSNFSGKKDEVLCDNEWISVRRPAFLTAVFCCFPQSSKQIPETTLN